MPQGIGANILAEDGAAGAAGSYTAIATRPLQDMDLNILSRCALGSQHADGGHAHLQPRNRNLHFGPDGNHQRYNAELDHLLHHQRNRADHRSTVYSTPITVSSTETLRSVRHPATHNSSVGNAYYIINLPQAATPSFSPAAGSLHFGPDGNHQRYNRRRPSTTPPTARRRRPASSTSTPLRSLSPPRRRWRRLQWPPATATARSQSGVYSIILPAATPTFSPVAGSYSTVQTVTISDTTPAQPSTTPPTGPPRRPLRRFTAVPITVPAPETLEAVAIASGYCSELSRIGGIHLSRPISRRFIRAAVQQLRSTAVADNVPHARLPE